MNEGFDAVALGELLADFTENGKNAQGNGLFEAFPRGAQRFRAHPVQGFLGKSEPREPLNKSLAAYRQIFFPIRAVLKMGNTYSIPPFLVLSAEPKSSAASSYRFNQSFPGFHALYSP